MESMDDTAIVKAFTRQLRYLADALPSWGRDKPLPPVTSHHVTRWGADPLCCGSYSYLPVGALPADRLELGRSVGSSLYFCGEATHPLYPSTVHGAYMSGVEAAAQLCGALMGQSCHVKPDATAVTAACWRQPVGRSSTAVAAPAYQMAWGQLSDCERSAAGSLGMSYGSWDLDDGSAAAVEAKGWSELSNAQRCFAKALGYTAAAWDAEDSSSNSSSEDEEEGEPEAEGESAASL
jgi:hypothetical protein